MNLDVAEEVIGITAWPVGNSRKLSKESAERQEWVDAGLLGNSYLDSVYSRLSG